jgi:3-hydroxybutyrate dehydrogenase
MTLKGKSAVVTGSTSGIGLGIAEALARQGAAVMLNGLGEPEAIEKIRSEMAARWGVPVGYHGADMTRPAEIAALIAAAAEAHGGGVDILVNNAGIQHVDPIERFPAERWDAIIAINLSAAFHAIQAALPTMRARGWGRIVNIASVHGLVASANKVAYVAAKHGLVGLTRVVGLETAGSGVTCNAICPGWVLTPLVRRQIEARAREQGIPFEAAQRDLLVEKQPSGQFVTPEQIGDLTVFLCSEAAAQMNGAALTLDGGWTAQ